MAFEMVLNEHSLLNTSPSVDKAKEYITILAETITAIIKMTRKLANVDVKFWTQGCVRYTPLSTENDESHTLKGCLDALLKENGQNRDSYLVLLYRMTNQPYWDKDPEPNETMREFTDIEFWHEGIGLQRAMCGLGFAYLRDALAISFPSEAHWKAENIKLEVSWSDTCLGDVITVEEKIANASDVSHVAGLSTWIEERCRIKIESGQDLWDNRDTLFPMLKYSTEVERNFTTMNKDKVPLVYRKLSNFNTYCEEWKKRGGGFGSGAGLMGSPRPESHSVKKDPKLYKEREFTRPCGTRDFFEWHVSITDVWRLHFFPVKATQDIIIGYVGPHLPL